VTRHPAKPGTTDAHKMTTRPAAVEVGGGLPSVSPEKSTPVVRLKMRTTDAAGKNTATKVLKNPKLCCTVEWCQKPFAHAGLCTLIELGARRKAISKKVVSPGSPLLRTGTRVCFPGYWRLKGDNTGTPEKRKDAMATVELDSPEGQEWVKVRVDGDDRARDVDKEDICQDVEKPPPGDATDAVAEPEGGLVIEVEGEVEVDSDDENAASPQQDKPTEERQAEAGEERPAQHEMPSSLWDLNYSSDDDSEEEEEEGEEGEKGAMDTGETPVEEEDGSFSVDKFLKEVLSDASDVDKQVNRFLALGKYDKWHLEQILDAVEARRIHEEPVMVE